MADSRFFPNAGPFTLSRIAAAASIALPDGADAGRHFHDVAPLDRATEKDVSFLDNVKYTDTFAHSRAGACFIRPRFAEYAPKGMILLITEEPYRSFALAAQAFYPCPAPSQTLSSAAFISPSATIGQHCTIEHGAIIEDGVTLGDHCHIGYHAVIGRGVAIGSHTRIGAGSTLSHCLIGSHVIIHRGVHIGQDGFGFAMGAAGHVKVPQLGRVVIENNVEIGSGTCIDRGTGPDTFVGDGTKIDNLVQIGHNVHIGKQVVIVAQVGIAGSTRIGDGAVLAGQVGLAGHLKIGAGARIAAQSGVMTDVPPGGAFGGSPAVTVKDWHRQTIALARMGKKKGVSDE